MTTESWKSFWETAGAILALIAAVCVVIALKLSDKVNATEKAEKDKFNLQFQEQKERTAKAETTLLELRKKVVPRTIDKNVFLEALKELKGAPPKGDVEIMYLRDDPECFILAEQIYHLLREAGWPSVSPVPIPAISSPGYSFAPSAMGMGGQPSGVSVVAHSISESESKAWWNKQSGKDWERTPFTVLSEAFSQSLGQVGGGSGGAYSPQDGSLRVVVAPRM